MQTPRGPRSVNYIAIRLALLAFLLVGGALFHHHGHGYDVVHAIYIVAIVGFLGWRLWRRSALGPPRWRRARGGNNPGPPNGPGTDSGSDHGPGSMF